MIPLFNIPQHKIDTSKFSNLLHDKIVTEFEQNIADYVGAKYCVTFNSATSAIFLLLSWIIKNIAKDKYSFAIPSVIPPVVPNTFINAGMPFRFTDNSSWVGYQYKMNDNKIMGYMDIIDSAHAIYQNQYEIEGRFGSVIIYSFYPTKPISGCDGGAIVSNDEGLISHLRLLSKNGISNNTPRIIGHKMYMNSIQAYIANENLKNFDKKMKRLDEIRKYYKESILDSIYGNSSHLFIIKRKNNNLFVMDAKDNGITCGIHYKSLHNTPQHIYGYCVDKMEKSDEFSDHCVSIPYHEALTDEEVEAVIKYCNEHE